MDESKEAARWGETLYWTATVIAGLIVVWVVWTYVFNTESGYPVFPVVALLLAGAIWLVGRACRYMLGER